jgi:predicted Fe-Mo cluster-binding NifX family protein
MLNKYTAMSREKPLKIAIPLFNSRVSPRFDFAAKLLVVTIVDGKITDRQEFSLANLNPIKRTSLLHELRVQLMLCGGISCFAERFIKAYGIEVIPLVQGEVEEVLTLFVNGNLSSAIIPIIPEQAFRQRCRIKRKRNGRRKSFISEQ